MVKKKTYGAKKKVISLNNKEKVLTSEILEYGQVGQFEKKTEESLPLITGLSLFIKLL